eukprot:CAMPEP_0119054740 /NCGR_PEP_ID=MMETSP1177-20130426/75279_1 /TAXON_ID=2985 /ORGANISM="Ochromonas sp, Strain CCMP1899" /LENGTH=111 /DNA_ID=CAMNT_0007035089 /DNA_START=499 /DNA_END=831 /DNA_ORIENTATION=-
MTTPMESIETIPNTNKAVYINEPEINSTIEPGTYVSTSLNDQERTEDPTGGLIRPSQDPTGGLIRTSLNGQEAVLRTSMEEKDGLLSISMSLALAELCDQKNNVRVSTNSD